MGPLLALGSAVSYGLADFFGGLLSRRVDATAVALIGQLGALGLMLVAALLWPATGVATADLAWGALSGAGTGVGMAFLYRGMARGDLSVVLPLSAVGGLGIPVLIGVLLLGDRPSVLAWIGIAVAVPALWLVSRSRDGGARSTEGTAAAGTTDGLVASVGIAVQYLALAQASPAAGLWPIVAGRVAAVLAILPLAVRKPLRMPPRHALGAVATGGLAALALVLYLLATRQQLVAIAVVLSSLYPAIPVLLGITALRERLAPHQSAGLIGAGLAIGLLATG